MIDLVQNILVQVSDFLWSYVIITVLICCAVFFTLRTRFVQFRLVREMVRLLLHPDKVQPNEIGQDELSMDMKVNGEMKHISSFQAFVVALASRIGTGNLAGVATAISIGGPGAVFWMWMLALLGSASAFIESTLAQLYKRKGKTSFYGGQAYYMKYGLGKGWMGILFAVLMIITFGFAYNSVQSNTICLAWQKAFGIEPATMGIVLTALTLLIIFGGIHRVAKFSSTVVPVMAVVYLLIALGVVAWNITYLPKVLLTILENAFGFNQAAGGVLGVTIIQGIKRGLFSNEAGEGSAPNAAAVATVSHPVKQGLIQALGVFTDTLVVCSCTAFIILVSGVDVTASNGIQLTQDALTHEIGSIGNPFVAVMIWLFAFSSIIGNYYYGETNVRYVKDTKRGNVLPLVQFYRQSVGVAEEYKLLASIFVRAYRLVFYALAVEFADGCREIVHLESKVSQTGCFRIGWTSWRIREGEQFHDVCVAKPTVCLPRVTFLTIMFTYYLQAEHLNIELL